MTPEQIKKERKNFINWYKKQNIDFSIEPDSFIAFQGWLAAKEQAAAKACWFNVEERLPSPDETVLLIDYRSNMQSGYLDGDALAFVYTDEGSLLDDGVITHWRYLPEDI